MDQTGAPDPPFNGSISSSLLEGVRRLDSEAWGKLSPLFGPEVYRWAGTWCHPSVAPVDRTSLPEPADHSAFASNCVDANWRCDGWHQVSADRTTPTVIACGG